jgi:hypothetical protein
VIENGPKKNRLSTRPSSGGHTWRGTLTSHISPHARPTDAGSLGEQVASRVAASHLTPRPRDLSKARNHRERR